MHHPSCCVVSFSQGLREVGEKKRKMCAKRPAAETRATKPNPNFRVCGRATKETKETTSNQTPTFHADRITHACVRSKTNKGTATKVQQQQQQQQQKKKKKQAAFLVHVKSVLCRLSCLHFFLLIHTSAYFSPLHPLLLLSPTTTRTMQATFQEHRSNGCHCCRITSYALATICSTFKRKREMLFLKQQRKRDAK